MSIQAGFTEVRAGEIIHCSACQKTFQTSNDGKLGPCYYCGSEYYEYGEGKENA